MRRREIPTSLMAALAAAFAARPASTRSISYATIRGVTAAEKSVGAGIVDPSYPPGHARRYGAMGNGKADDTRALSDALRACHEGGYTLQLPMGRFRITAQLEKPQSFTCPHIRGQGYRYTQLLYAEVASGAAIYVRGGSGRMCGAVIEGIRFEGSEKSCGLEIDGQCGLTIRDCEFGANAVGIRLHNSSHDAFTESVVAETCHFDESCQIALQYQVSGGKDSFNGSGLWRCSVVLAGERGAVLIGRGAVPYNAPLMMQIWTVGPNRTVIVSESERVSQFHGSISLEAYGKLANESGSPKLARGGAVHLLGEVMTFGYADFGSLVTGARAVWFGPEAGKSNGQQAIRRHPWSRRVALTRGENVVEGMAALSGVIAHVELTAPGYEYRCVVGADAAAGVDSAAAVLAMLGRVDDVGYGPPIFRLNAKGEFVIKNDAFPLSGLTGYVDFLPFGLSRALYGAGAVEYGSDAGGP